MERHPDAAICRFLGISSHIRPFHIHLLAAVTCLLCLFAFLRPIALKSREEDHALQVVTASILAEEKLEEVRREIESGGLIALARWSEEYCTADGGELVYHRKTILLPSNHEQGSHRVVVRVSWESPSGERNVYLRKIVYPGAGADDVEIVRAAR